MTTITALGVGSGLDLSGLLDQLRQGEQKQLIPITTRKADYKAKISAFGALQSALTSFQDAAKALANPTDFQPVKSSVSGDALKATTSATTPPGDYQIQVSQLARASSVATQGVTDQEAALGAGNISFTLANGESVSVSVDAVDSSLEDIRDAINDTDGGVRASIINDGSGQPYRLVLRASATGTEAAVSNIQIDGALAGRLQLDSATEQSGADAKLSINGIDITSADNRVSGAIQGVTLNVAQTGTATLQVARDDAAITKGVNEFVDAYNKLVKSLDTLTGYDAKTQQAGILLGDSTVRGVESRLRKVLSSAVQNGGDFKTLSDVGISLQLDGTLQLDGDKLEKVLSDKPGALTRFFAGGAEQDGIGDLVNTAVEKMNAEGGLIGNATEGLKDRMDQMDQLYDRTQKRIDTVMARYKTQFSQLDSMIAKMNSTSAYLTQQFDALSNISSSGK